MIKLKLVPKQFEEFYKTVNSASGIQTELDNFLSNFYMSILKLFSTFIEDFYELLLPNEKIYIERMNA